MGKFAAPCSLDRDCWKKDGHTGPHAYADRARTLDARLREMEEIDRLRDEVIVTARLVVNEFLTRPASLAARHVERLDDLRNALIALGPQEPTNLGQQTVYSTPPGRRITG